MGLPDGSAKYFLNVGFERYEKVFEISQVEYEWLNEDAIGFLRATTFSIGSVGGELAIRTKDATYLNTSKEER